VRKQRRRKKIYVAKDGEKYLLDEDKKTIQRLKELSKPKLSTRTCIWLVGVLLISTGVGLADYRAGLVVAGFLLLLTVMVSD
jgi:hypothetical protein